MAAWTDPEWVRQLKQENEQALQTLWELLYRTAIKLGWRYNCSEQDATDVALSAYDKVLTSGLNQFRFESKFTTFCYTIVVREMSKKAKKLSLRDSRELSIDGNPYLEYTLSTPERSPIANITVVHDRLAQCLQRLKEIEQQVINHIYLAGQTPEQVAQELQMTRNYVNVVAHRARLKLHHCLVSLGYHTVSEVLSL